MACYFKTLSLKLSSELGKPTKSEDWTAILRIQLKPENPKYTTHSAREKLSYTELLLMNFSVHLCYGMQTKCPRHDCPLEI
jgi:hypothetical protein